MSRHILHVDFDYDFELIALVSSWRDYRLCWQINRVLHMEFSRKPDLEITDPKRRIHAQFPLFSYEDEINFLQYFLIGNKSFGVYLIPEMRQVDYLMMIRGDAAGATKHHVVLALKNTAGIEMLFEMNPAALRSRQNLILE